MVGAEWRNASRVFEAYLEKIKEGVYFTNEQSAAHMFKAWDCLPQTFRDKIERRIWDKQLSQVRAQAEQDLETKARAYDERRDVARAAEAEYRKKLEEVRVETAKLENMRTAIEMAKSLRTFLKALGVDQNIRWNSVEI